MIKFDGKKTGIFAAGVAFGTAGIKILTSKDAKKLYTNCTAAVLRAKACVMKTASAIQENAEDIYQAIAERYLAIGCSVMTPNPNRFDLRGRLIDEYQVDGVLEMTLQACHTYNVESLSIRKFVNEKKGIPYINVETDYSQADIGQLNTRIAAFIEML